MISILMAATLLVAATPSAAAAADAPGAAAAPATPKVEKAKGNDTICWDERPTGSHLSKHFCATRDEREKMEHDAQEAVASRSRPSPPPGMGPAR